MLRPATLVALLLALLTPPATHARATAATACNLFLNAESARDPASDWLGVLDHHIQRQACQRGAPVMVTTWTAHDAAAFVAHLCDLRAAIFEAVGDPPTAPRDTRGPRYVVCLLR